MGNSNDTRGRFELQFDDQDRTVRGRRDVNDLPSVIKDVPPPLSSRVILLCLMEGDSNKVIARKLGIAEATVKVHVKAILRKIRVHNRTQAAIWFINNKAALRR